MAQTIISKDEEAIVDNYLLGDTGLAEEISPLSFDERDEILRNSKIDESVIYGEEISDEESAAIAEGAFGDEEMDAMMEDTMSEEASDAITAESMPDELVDAISMESMPEEETDVITASS
ncbi:MAG: hypothetical protein CVT89_04940, partial [Candidatus Altiarchaeales archaeon HGW-Altiarchaeales-2]